MKSLGIAITTAGTLRVTTPTRAEDLIWSAVEQAIEEGMRPEDFKREAAECWSEYLRREAKAAAKMLLQQ